jgi:Do/DeqQ family serine protease
LKIERLHIIYLLLISVLVSVGSIWIYDSFFNPWKSFTANQRKDIIAVAENDILFSDRFNQVFKSSQPTDFVTAAELSRKAVVFIKSNGQSNLETNGMAVNSGSGVIISGDGYIITNHHVVQNASKIEITLYDNRVVSAKVVGNDPNTDISLLKIDLEDLDFLVFGNSDSLLIGEWVMAVGNPFRLQSTVTAGIVSAKARNINLLENQGIESFIQTDAAVNPGNSGGALINTRGDLMGICTAIQSNSGRYEGFSFAIPANLAKKVVADIREFGAVQRGWLGIEIENMDNLLANDLKLSEVAGVYIASVFKDGGAYDAGIKNEDVIRSVNNIKTDNTAEFMEQLAQYRPGDQVTLSLYREGNRIEVSATLRNQLNSTDLIGVRDDAVLKEIGLELRDADKYEKAVFAPQGVIVVSIMNGSIISKTKMEPGYIITKVNNRDVTSVNMLIKILSENAGKAVVFDGFYPKIPGEYPYTFVLPK